MYQCAASASSWGCRQSHRRESPAGFGGVLTRAMSNPRVYKTRRRVSCMRPINLPAGPSGCCQPSAGVVAGQHVRCHKVPMALLHNWHWPSSVQFRVPASRVWGHCPLHIADTRYGLCFVSQCLQMSDWLFFLSSRPTARDKSIASAGNRAGAPAPR